MKKIACILTLLLFSCLLQAQQFHAIIVADMNDLEIGKSCEIDANMMMTEVNTIATSIGYEPDISIVSRGNFNFECVRKAVEELTCNEKDIVFFYYSGHGYNDTANSGEFPVMNLKNGFYALEEVHRQLKSKNPKFCLTLGDCCNVIHELPDFKTRGFNTVDIGTKIENNYKNLFLQPQGDILVSSSKRGQWSYSNFKDGGIYTSEFISSLRCAVNYSKTLSWESLLLDTKNRISRYNFVKGKQVPQFYVNLDADIYSPKFSFDVINNYLNDIADEQIDDEKRYDLLSQKTKYFKPRAKVNIYDSQSTTRVQLVTIEDFLETAYLNSSKIRQINLIEKKSKLNEKDEKYESISVQRVWWK